MLQRAEIEQRAEDVIRKHGLFSIPVDPVLIAQREGIRVHNAKFSDSGLSGLVAKRGASVSILVNEADPPFRKRFTIAHELGHHFLHLLADGDIVDKSIDLFRDTEPPEQPLTTEARQEIQANQFAAALLMPAALVRTAYKETADLSVLARRFNVSETAMGYRLTRLGLV